MVLLFVRKGFNNPFLIGYNYSVMKKYIAIQISKILKKIGAKFNRGSSLPGQIALKVCPDILSRIKLPEYTIAVTGSNGKTSTVEMIYQVLTKAGYTVAYNYEGSNQIEGVTTLILDNCDNNGVFNKDVLLMEVDERYAQYVFKYFTPKYFVVNNLYRDQMTRNGNPEFVLGEIKKAIHEDSILVLNSDDPIIAALGEEYKNEVVYFGIEDNQYTTEEDEDIYNDGYYCPICKSKMIYDYHHFSHVGKYRCSKCDFSRPEPEYAITQIDLEKGKLVINNKAKMNIGFKAIHNAYNMLAAYTITSLMGISQKMIVKALDKYLINNGRFRRFRLGNTEGTLLISKHENSISYNSNIQYVVDRDEDVNVLFIVDDISRKYFTSDTSWIWDINFEKLNNEHIKEIVIAGKYIYDMALRFEYAGIDSHKLVLKQTAKEAIDYLRDSDKELYVLTCFSDEAKLLKEVEVEQ